MLRVRAVPLLISQIRIGFLQMAGYGVMSVAFYTAPAHIRYEMFGIFCRDHKQMEYGNAGHYLCRTGE